VRANVGLVWQQREQSKKMWKKRKKREKQNKEVVERCERTRQQHPSTNCRVTFTKGTIIKRAPSQQPTFAVGVGVKKLIPYRISIRKAEDLKF
jgi:hypothetical protein